MKRDKFWGGKGEKQARSSSWRPGGGEWEAMNEFVEKDLIYLYILTVFVFHIEKEDNTMNEKLIAKKPARVAHVYIQIELSDHLKRSISSSRWRKTQRNEGIWGKSLTGKRPTLFVVFVRENPYNMDCTTFTTETFTNLFVKSDVHHPRRSPPPM